MEQIDWQALRTDGTPACWEALRRLEAGLLELQGRVEELALMIPVQHRLEPWWFKRYAELYGMLVAAGMPAEAEGAAVARWLSEKRGGDGRPANGNGNGTGRPIESVAREAGE